MPDRPLEISRISLSAEAIPVRTSLICTGTLPANLLRTPMRGQSYRLFAAPDMKRVSEYDVAHQIVIRTIADV